LKLPLIYNIKSALLQYLIIIFDIIDLSLNYEIGKLPNGLRIQSELGKLKSSP